MKESDAPEKDMAEIRERIAKAKEELARRVEGLKWAGPSGHPTPEAMAKLEEMGRRIKHFRTAAENLREAGAHDVAKELMEKAEHMEREAREAKMRLTKEGDDRPGPKMGPLAGPLQEMREQIERLRAELNELRQRVKELEQRR
jgi:phage shock protein A